MEVYQRWRAEEAQMRDNPEGGKLDLLKVSAGTERIMLLPFYPE